MNKLIVWINEQGMSARQLGITLELSHSHVAKVLRGDNPITWDFAARVADKMGLDPLEAFRMAGLLKEGAGLGGDAQTGPEKVTNASIAQSAAAVTNGAGQ